MPDINDNDNDIAHEPTDGAEPTQGEPFDAIAAVAEIEAAMAAADARGSSGGSDRYIETLESEVLELGALLEARDAELARLEARAGRADEELEQAKLRLQHESARQIARGTRTVLLGFIEVLDELDRALDALRAGPRDPELVTGIEQVRRRFLGVLESHGVHERPALGEPFDPAFHEAVTTAPAPADAQGRVVAVMRAGYTIGEADLLRPAAVVVGRAS